MNRLLTKLHCTLTLRRCSTDMEDIPGGKKCKRCEREFVYPTPSYPNEDAGSVTMGMSTCTKSGQLVFTSRLSDSAIDEVLR